MRSDAPFNTTLVRAALVNLLKDQGIEADEHWLSIRTLPAPGLAEMLYLVVIGYARAKAAMWPELDLLTGQTQGKSEVGIWVLSAEQADILCKRHLPAE